MGEKNQLWNEKYQLGLEKSRVDTENTTLRAEKYRLEASAGVQTRKIEDLEAEVERTRYEPSRKKGKRGGYNGGYGGQGNNAW